MKMQGCGRGVKGKVKVWSVLEVKKRFKNEGIVRSLRTEVPGNLRNRNITGFCIQEYIGRFLRARLLEVKK